MKSIEFEKIRLKIDAGTSIDDVFLYCSHLILDPRYNRLKEINFNFNGMEIKIVRNK